MTTAPSPHVQPVTMTTAPPPSGLQLVAGLGAVGRLAVDAAVVVVLPAADEQCLLVAAEVTL